MRDGGGPRSHAHSTGNARQNVQAMQLDVIEPAEYGGIRPQERSTEACANSGNFVGNAERAMPVLYLDRRAGGDAPWRGRRDVARRVEPPVHVALGRGRPRDVRAERVMHRTGDPGANTVPIQGRRKHSPGAGRCEATE